MSTAPALQRGAVVDGRYRLDEPLDDFGVGECWTARDTADGSAVTLKLLPPIGATEHGLATRFRDHARALERFRHRAVTSTLRHGIWSGRPYLVLEPFAGVSLGKGFALARTGRHLLAPGVLANLFDRACEAVGDAHRAEVPLVHGALMPGSIVAALLAGRFEVRVVDFGLAQLFGDRLKIARSTEYMAPSLEDDPERATVIDDVFALGTILMEAVTDRRDAQAGVGTLGNLSAVAKRRADMPAALMAIAARATRVDARQRFPDVPSLRDALAAAWSPDARAVVEDAPAAPSGVAGIASEYTSWVRFSEEDLSVTPTPIAPSPPPVAAPVAFADPTPIAAFVSAPEDLVTTQRTPHETPSELFGPTTRLATPTPSAAPAPDLGQTFVAMPHAPAAAAAQPAAMPPTQLLPQYEAPVVPPPAPWNPAPAVVHPPPVAYAPPVVAPTPRVMYGQAPPVPTARQVAPRAGGRRAVFVVAALVALVAVIALVAWFASGP